MTVEAIDIRIREDGARVVRRELDWMQGSANKAADAVDLLKKALAGLGGLLLARQVVELVNKYGDLQNRLRSVGLEGSSLATVYGALLKASNDTRSSVEGSVELYSRLAISSKELGVSQKQLIDFTTSLNQAILLSGASGAEAAGGLAQLSQGLASGTLRGDELRSVLENLPAVADVIAKGLGVTRGQLRQLGEDGKISAQAVLKAFRDARGELNDRFAKTVPTISQAFQVLKNNVLTMVGALDTATGFSAGVSRALLALAGNLDTVARSVAGLASGLVLVGGSAAALRAVAAGVQAITAAVAANPVGAFLVVLTSVVTTLFLFRDQIKLGTDAVTTLGDFLRALGDVAGPAFVSLLSSARAVLGPLGDAISAWASSADVSVIGVITGVAKAVDTFIGLWRGAVSATVALFEGVPPALSDIFTRALNVVLEKIGLFVNSAGELLNSVTQFAGLDKIVSKVDFTLTNDAAGAAKRLGSDVASAFSSGFNQSNPAQQFVADIAAKAKELGAARDEAARLAARFPAQPSDVAGKPSAVPVDAKELEKATNALRSLLNTIQPSSGAVLELAKAQKTLTEAQKMGLLTGTQHNQYLALARKYYEDTINPLGKINRELDEQTKLLGFNAKQREVEAQVLQTTKELQQQGIVLTTMETESLRKKYTALQQLNVIVQAQDAIYAESIGKRAAFEAQLTALQNAATTPGFTAGDLASSTAGVLTNAGIDIEGTQVAIDAQTAQFAAMYAKIDAMRQANLISEQTAVQLAAKVAAEQDSVRLKNAESFFGNLAVLSKSGNSKLAAIGRASAIAQATIDGVLAVQKALASAPPPVNYVLAAGVGVAAAANVSAIAKQGFQSGGYTGNGGVSEVAGVVHGQEFVANAQATRNNRDVLEAMNRGAVVSNQPTAFASGGQAVVKVSIINNADGTRIRQEEKDGPDGRELEVTIERVAARSISNGGLLASAVESQYGLNRAQGSTY